MKKIILLLFIFCYNFACAQTLLSENFDYPIGTVLTGTDIQANPPNTLVNALTGWGAHSGNSQRIDVQSGLTFPGYINSGIGGGALVDNTGEDVSKGFSPINSTNAPFGSVYTSFLLKVVNSTTTDYFFHYLRGDGSNFSGRLYVNNTGTGLALSNATAPTVFTPITLGNTYLIVLRYDISTREHRLYVFDAASPNPFPSTEPETENYLFDDGGGFVELGKVALRQYSASQNIIVDGIRVGTTWANAVTPAACTTYASYDGTTWTGTPNATAVVDITGDLTTTTGLTACTCTVTKGNFVVSQGTLDIQEGLTVGSLDAMNIPTATIASGANIIQNNTLALNKGNITVNQNSAPMVKLDYTAWSSPVTAQKLKAFSPETLDNRFYTYDPISNAYVVVSNPATTNFETGVGYLIRASDNSSPTAASAYNGQFIGIPVNGTKTTPVSIGFNLVGNPYPSKLNALSFLSNANTTALGITTLHFWSNTIAAVGGVYATNNYASFNAMGGTASASNSEVPNGTISVGQGFFVNPTTAGNVTFDNAMRSTTASTQFFKSASVVNLPADKHRFWLNLTTPTTANNQILIGYTADASNDFDAKYDATLFGNTASVIYSKVADKKLAIQGRTSFATTDVLPLGLEVTEASQFTISLADFDGLFVNQNIYLRDNVLNTIQDLKVGSYTFNAAQGELDTRFDVVFENSVLATNNNSFNHNVIAIKNANGISIQSGNSMINSVSVFDMQSRLVLNKSNLKANSVDLNTNGFKNQVLLLKITNTNNQTVTKKVVN